jgi:hypothetical protein
MLPLYSLFTCFSPQKRHNGLAISRVKRNFSAAITSPPKRWRWRLCLIANLKIQPAKKWQKRQNILNPL